MELRKELLNMKKFWQVVTAIGETLVDPAKMAKEVNRAD